MCFLHTLPQAIVDFIQAGTGSSAYEDALVWALVAVVCIIAVIVLM